MRRARGRKVTATSHFGNLPQESMTPGAARARIDTQRETSIVTDSIEGLTRRECD
jgi:hypothetical protein